jgi:hypothetical protein
MATTEISKSSWIMALSRSSLSHELIAELINDASVDMLERIAESSATPAEILQTLACWNDPMVRAAVAENPSCPVALMRQLASDRSPDVRYRLAECHHVPAEILETMLDDDNCYVAFRVRKTLDRLRPAAPRTIAALIPRADYRSGKMAI